MYFKLIHVFSRHISVNCIFIFMYPTHTYRLYYLEQMEIDRYLLNILNNKLIVEMERFNLPLKLIQYNTCSLK